MAIKSWNERHRIMLDAETHISDSSDSIPWPNDDKPRFPDGEEPQQLPFGVEEESESDMENTVDRKMGPAGTDSRMGWVQEGMILLSDLGRSHHTRDSGPAVYNQDAEIHKFDPSDKIHVRSGGKCCLEPSLPRA